jgi:outer membrane immunogenic protein
MFRVSVVAILVTGAGVAAAADMPIAVKAPPNANPYVFDWTGLYVGAHGGWAQAPIDFPGAPAYPAGPPRQTLNGALVGGQAGFNWQIQKLVLGIEADFSWADGMSGTVHDGTYMTENQSIDWTGTARGRAGWAFGQFLPYMTAGLAWDNASANVACPAGVQFGWCHTTGAFSFSDRQTHTGFVWGGGMEYAFDPRWSVKVEALHADMGTKTYNLGGSPWDIKHEFTSVSGGVNFKLY